MLVRFFINRGYYSSVFFASLKIHLPSQGKATKVVASYQWTVKTYIRKFLSNIPFVVKGLDHSSPSPSRGGWLAKQEG